VPCKIVLILGNNSLLQASAFTDAWGEGKTSQFPDLRVIDDSIEIDVFLKHAKMIQ
jgi:hypothetical protein